MVTEAYRKWRQGLTSEEASVLRQIENGIAWHLLNERQVAIEHDLFCKLAQYLADGHSDDPGPDVKVGLEQRMFQLRLLEVRKAYRDDHPDNNGYFASRLADLSARCSPEQWAEVITMLDHDTVILSVSS